MATDPHILTVPIDPKRLKKLRGQPVATFLSGYEPNERRTLWIIYHCKEAFNPRFTMQFVSKHIQWREQNGNFMKYSKIVSDLKLRGYAKQDKEYNWHITPIGYFHWLTLNSKAILWLAVIGMIIGLGIMKFNCTSKTKNNKETDISKQTPQPAQPASFDSPHTTVQEEKDSAVLRPDTTNGEEKRYHQSIKK